MKNKLTIEDLHRHISDFYETNLDDDYMDAYEIGDIDSMLDIISKFHDTSSCIICKYFLIE